MRKPISCCVMSVLSHLDRFTSYIPGIFLSILHISLTVPSRIRHGRSFSSTTPLSVLQAYKHRPFHPISNATTWRTCPMCPILYISILCLGHSFFTAAISFYYDQPRFKHQSIFSENKPGKKQTNLPLFISLNVNYYRYPHTQSYCLYIWLNTRYREQKIAVTAT